MTFASLSVHICIFRHFQVCQILSQIIQRRHFFEIFQLSFFFQKRKAQIFIMIFGEFTGARHRKK